MGHVAAIPSCANLKLAIRSNCQQRIQGIFDKQYCKAIIFAIFSACLTSATMLGSGFIYLLQLSYDIQSGPMPKMVDR